MATPLVAGLSVAAAALTARSALQYYQVWKVAPRLRKFYEGGFQEKMDESEALKILNLSNRQASAEARVKEAHRKIMMANHVDIGGSDYIAKKVNEAKNILTKKKDSDQAFQDGR